MTFTFTKADPIVSYIICNTRRDNSKGIAWFFLLFCCRGPKGQFDIREWINEFILLVTPFCSSILLSWLSKLSKPNIMLQWKRGKDRSSQPYAKNQSTTDSREWEKWSISGQSISFGYPILMVSLENIQKYHCTDWILFIWCI